MPERQPQCEARDHHGALPGGRGAVRRPVPGHTARVNRILPRQRRPERARRPVGSRFSALTGAPPARSALGLRTALAAFGLVFCGVVAGLFAAAGWIVPAILLCIAGATAAVDLAVIGVRARQRRRLRRPDGMSPGAAVRPGRRSDSYLP